MQGKASSLPSSGVRNTGRRGELASGRMRPNRVLGGIGGALPSCCIRRMRRSSHSRYLRKTCHVIGPFFTVSTYTVNGLLDKTMRSSAWLNAKITGTWLVCSGHAHLLSGFAVWKALIVAPGVVIAPPAPMPGCGNPPGLFIIVLYYCIILRIQRAPLLSAARRSGAAPVAAPGTT